jgi:DNA-binding PadR family transcriptional regulator
VSSLSAFERRALCILEAIEWHPLAFADIDEKLVDSGLPYDPETLRPEIALMAQEGMVRTSAFPAPGGNQITGIEITEDGRRELARLRGLDRAQLDPDELEERAEVYERAGVPPQATMCNAEEPELDLRETTATICMTDRELDAWWDSLTIDAKAEVLMNHYGAAAADNEVA